MIAVANDLIAKVDNSAFIDDHDVLNVKEEARFLRAFGYFMMMDMFGNVPLKPTPIMIIKILPGRQPERNFTTSWKAN
ncbi:MAG: RagB/SusD family nutrient uptake outer membrane protein [Tannerellaceae bacterium]|nr:RagB/SusD family nutrient uptake outer membrane protein [Tannerellaceae bacterium]MCD8263216.1 RagB/SusD family nutrient uptake outer membrane protein [Tannerellaceae bacterium]